MVFSAVHNNGKLFAYSKFVFCDLLKLIHVQNRGRYQAIK